MDRTERFIRIDQLINARRAVSMRTLMEELEVSRATLKRDLEYLRDRLNAPIVYDRRLNGYRYDTADPAGARFQLPGMWFNASEAHALLTMERLLEDLQPGLLARHVEPLRERIARLLGSGDHALSEVRRRIRVLPLAARRLRQDCFGVISAALLARRRLRIIHYNRAADRLTRREVSPQRLVNYRDNWYLDAWCHLRDGLRTFSVDAVKQAEQLEAAARRVSDRQLDAVLGAGYGIFAGRRTRTAVLRFSPERARYVSREQWHPKQSGRWDREGRYLLEIPYSDDRELVMDILRHGPDVEVLRPAALRRRVAGLVREAARRYR